MQLFFFDIYVGTSTHPDLDGSMFDNIEDVRREAFHIMSELARDHLRSGRAQVTKVLVRDEHGQERWGLVMSVAETGSLRSEGRRPLV